MNEDGAENAVLHDVTRGLIGNLTIWNACPLIHTWHFHVLTKMHHENARWPTMAIPYWQGHMFYEDFGPRIPHDGHSLESSSTIPNKPNSRVPTPYFYVPFCVNATCYSENLLSKESFLAGPRYDASSVTAILTNTTLKDRH